MRALAADKAYSSKTLRKLLAKKGITECIPPRSNEKIQYKHDMQTYRKRHVIENMFCRLKDWKGVTLRTNRNANSFKSFVAIALIVLFF